MLFKLECSGSYDKTIRSLEKMQKLKIDNVLNRYGQEGVNALKNATPIDTGKTANSWSYRIERGFEQFTIVWTNSNVNKGVNIAIILQYGHGTGTGGYVQGRDYINPAMRPIFDKIAEEAWREVVNL